MHAMGIYLANVQVLRRTKNKDPLGVSRPGRSVKDPPAFLVQEPAVLDHDFIVLSLFLRRYIKRMVYQPPSSSFSPSLLARSTPSPCEILTGPRYLMHWLRSFDLEHLPSRFISLPSPTSSLHVHRPKPRPSASNDRRSRDGSSRVSSQEHSPVEERLLAFGVEPAVVVAVKVVAVPVPRVNLLMKTNLSFKS
jgi:hypothetical protein